jgi:hypothetical protein
VSVTGLATFMTDNSVNSIRREALAPLDYVYFEKPQYTMSFLFDFGQRQDFEAMRTSLGRLLSNFYPIKGRIEAASNGHHDLVVDATHPFGSVAFECREIAKDQEPAYGNDLLALSESAGAGPDCALAKFVLHQMPQRSVLSTSMSHTLADGFSYFFFLAAWAAATRGVELPSAAHQRKLMRYEGHDYGDLSPEAVFERTGYSLLERSALNPPPLKRYESIIIADAEINRHRQDVERELGQTMSRNDVVTALLIKDCAQRWHTSGDTIRLMCQFDMRRLLPGIEPLFFGNAMRGASLALGFDEVTQSSVGQLAKLIHGTVANIARPQAEDTLRCMQGLVDTQGLSATRRLHAWHPEHGMLVTNLTRMPLDQVDFGRGAPQDVFPAGSHSSRSYILVKRQVGVEAFVSV